MLQHDWEQENRVGFSAQISLQQVQSIENAIQMAALITMRSIYTGADQPMAQIKTGAQGSFHIRTIVRVNIQRIIDAALPGSVHQSSSERIVIRAAGIFGADGNLPFAALQAFAHTTHVYGNRFGDTGGYRSGTAMPNLFKYSKMRINAAGRNAAALLQRAGIAQQNCSAQFII